MDILIIGTCKVYLSAVWVYSLKEKRMVVKSLIQKLRNRFNISVAEIEDQDVHRSIVIGFACVTNETRHANSIISNVLNYIESNCEAETTDTVISITSQNDEMQV